VSRSSPKCRREVGDCPATSSSRRGCNEAFAFASPWSFEVEKIARDTGKEDGPIICSLARAIREDIKAAAEALKPASCQNPHLFLPQTFTWVPAEEIKS